MSQNEAVELLSPVGRLVTGDCFKGNDKDAEGRPLVVKTGPNAGQPRTDFHIGLAVDKNDPAWPEFWGKIHNKAREDFPSLFDASGNPLNPHFAFKVIDGDSTVPNSRGNVPCQRPGWAGCWVVMFSDGFAPTCYTKGGESVITDPSAIQRGYYIRVMGSVKGNGSMQQPGVYLNFKLVELWGYGEVIQTGPDAKAAFGGNAPAYTPPGMTAAPTAGAAPGIAPATQPAPMPAPQPQGAPMAAPQPAPQLQPPTGAAPLPMPQPQPAPAAAPPAVQPDPAFVQGPGAPAPQAAPMAAPTQHPVPGTPVPGQPGHVHF